MKVIQVTTFFHPVVGGVETQVLSLSEKLKEAGYDVEVITSDSTKKGRIKEKISEVGGIQVTRCFTWFGFSHFHKFYPSLFFKLLRRDFDIVHVHGFRKFEVYAALLAAKLKGKKIVVSTHNPFVVEKGSRMSLLNFLIKIHDLTAGKILSRFIDHVIILSKEEYPVLEKFKIKKEKITLVPNGINERFFEKGDSEKIIKDYNIDTRRWKNFVVSAGRIHKVKGYQNLKHAVHKLKNVLFIISGADDGYLVELKKLYEDNENVLFLERNLSQEQVNNLFALADLFVFPSLHEAFGITLVEAMASGLPVLSTNVGGPGDIVKEEFGVLVDPVDLGIWASKIQWLLADPRLRDKMGDSARRGAKRYRWERVLSQTEKVYKDLFPEKL
ncbi:glycosyltransferase family 4 protein [Candidatus Dojkabacteria bacterium]|nr:glycosyltransferase family 4 protein [Candidatus Dojkabacteria bacterium]